MKNKITITRDNAEEDKTNREKIKMISRFCRYSLEMKWNIASCRPIVEMCPFCWISSPDCETCLVPVRICGRQAQTGFISDLRKKYGDKSTVDHLSKDDLEKMIFLFNECIVDDDDNDEYEFVKEQDYPSYIEVPR